MADTALLVIDVQNIYELPDSPLCVPGFKQSLGRINRLVEGFEAAGEPVIYVRHVHRADGRDAGRMFDFSGAAEPVGFVDGSAEAEYVPGLRIVPDGLHMTKHRYSCFEGTELEAILRSLGVKTVAICGYMTNFCCETTARAAHDKDYFVNFIADATGAPDLGEEYRQSAIIQAVCATLGAGFARILTTEEYLQAMR
ncbi:cysteine hydrolase family protein [Acidocella aminolytica]|jgi:ureidoacrylate peracid hydrolase|uniref:Benzamide amidohydrolase n=1 Tax=Acidocella aminolytica 101 = DSM 11237 TaxID=1120923 RepID=A0A0D6PJM7_9PROT|nr:isochorismatase family cysteine hydrolase [Acidocella aminolytica]GAN81872.1 benzamide amidohydrolase [Acidocella aminolytica 101 = DSM 11237]GBQ42537.1 isochorismatase hydrolase [Acidocella aminolytica 101 = DSM 11237]SHF20202.1 ureidoacrylate peracid hydrolase [Acidocella aminolytica 101 = DSM 11237]